MEKAKSYEDYILTSVDNAIYDHLATIQAGEVEDGESFVFGFLWEAVKADMILKALADWGIFTPEKVERLRGFLHDYVSNETEYMAQGPEEDQEEEQGPTAKDQEAMNELGRMLTELNKGLERCAEQLKSTNLELRTDSGGTKDRAFTERVGQAFLELNKGHYYDRSPLGESLRDINRLVMDRAGERRATP